ncbi:MAG: dethiobiotin synthase [Elusimicrobia bacterium]|nr:dethiobiotin synthase [Elusimicrobiota bacterium]
MINFFVTGTDTGVGKSMLSLGLMQYLFGAGYNPRYFKPFQTGRKDDPHGDAGFIYGNVRQLAGRDPGEAVLYDFYQPLAPLFAAGREGTEVEPGRFNRAIAELAAGKDPLVIEGSGGLLVPVTATETVADLIGRIPRVKVLVAARCGLGTINHTLLTLGALKQRELPVAGVVMVDSGGAAPVAEDLKENIRAIETFSSCKVLGVIPRVSDPEKDLRPHFHIFEALLEA